MKSFYIFFTLKPNIRPTFVEHKSHNIPTFCRTLFKVNDVKLKSFPQRFGSISFWRGSGSWDPHLGKVDPDPPFRNSGTRSGSSDPHLEKVDPDPVPKWIRIRIRVPIFHIFHKEIHVRQITMLILLPPKFRKGISQITKTFSFTFYSK